MTYQAAQNVELPVELTQQTYAKTVGDILEIDFPVAVAKVNTAKLATFVKDADMRTYDIDDEPNLPHIVSDVRLGSDGKLRSTPSIKNIHPAFKQCAAITRELEKKLLEFRGNGDPDTYRLLMEGRANPFPKFMDGHQDAINVHADLADNPPNGRRYIAQSEQPTLFVSHDDTTRILKEYGYEHILGLEIDPNSPDLKKVQEFFLGSQNMFSAIVAQFEDIDVPDIQLQRALLEALQPAEDGVLTAFTPLTYHTSPIGKEQGRITFQADAHNSPGYHYSPADDQFLMALTRML